MNPKSTGTIQSNQTMRIPSEALRCWRGNNRATRSHFEAAAFGGAGVHELVGRDIRDNVRED